MNTAPSKEISYEGYFANGKQSTIETYPEDVVLQRPFLVPRWKPLELLQASEEVSITKSHIVVYPP